MAKAVEHEPVPQDSEPTPSQQAVKELADRMLALRPEGSPITNIIFETAAEAAEIEQRLRQSSAGDLLLADGESLSAPWSDLELFVGQAELTGVDVRAWGWEYEKARREPDGTITTYPGEKDWLRKLDIRLWYSNGKQQASQKIGITAGSADESGPAMLRDVYAPAYAEMGYDGHNDFHRSARDEAEVTEFVELVEELFDSRLS